MLKWLFLFFAFTLLSCSTSRHTARLVLLPDTQAYAESFPEVLDSQISYILREKQHIDLVLQQGDLTQNNNHKEWKIVRSAFQKLDHQVPYVLALGNHDMGSADGKFADVRNTELYNQYFPYSNHSTLPAFAGSFDPGKTDNSYYKLKKGKYKWLILSLEFGPRDTVLNWANEMIRRHADHTVILNTHSYLYFDSTRQGPGDNWRPQAYGVGKDRGDSSVNDGEQIWNKLVRIHPNVRFVFSGHVLTTGVGNLVSINDHGYPVYQMLANYQPGVKGSVKGGNGWLRIIDLDLKKKTIRVRTYSPFINAYKEEPGHHFMINEAVLGPGQANQN